MSTPSIPPQMDDEQRRMALLGVAPFQATGTAAGLNLPPVGIGKRIADTQSATNAKPSPQVAAPVDLSSQVASPFPPAQLPAVKAPLGTTQGDEAKLSQDRTSGAGVTHIAQKIENSGFGQRHPTLGKILGWGAQIPAMIGDTVAESVSPIARMALSNVPGTYAHQFVAERNDARNVAQDETNAKDEAQTANLNAQPEIKQAQTALKEQQLQETARQHDQQLREHGFKTDELGKIVPLPYAEMNPNQQAVNDLKGAQEEEAEATAALKKEQADPNSPQARMAQQRIDNARQTRAIAMERLGLSEKTFDARYHGTDEQGQALPGAMLTDEGTPVGSSFSANVRPTGTERNKADMAGSAKEQLGDIAEIVAKHPDMFGPGYGQSSAFKQWIGSQDPDAQRFVAARTIAGDHLAGTFGGRSEYALTALDNAIGQYKDNPEALKAGLQQLTKANERFLKAGTVRTAGSSTGEGPKEGDAKTNSTGDKIVFKGGKWQPQ